MQQLHASAANALTLIYTGCRTCTCRTHYETKTDLEDQYIPRSAYTTNTLHAVAVAITTAQNTQHTHDECTQM
jgi:hypothetical protein